MAIKNFEHSASEIERENLQYNYYNYFYEWL